MSSKEIDIFYKKFILKNTKMMDLDLKPLKFFEKSDKILCSTKYGNVIVYKHNIKKQICPSIYSSINKKNYFLKELKDKNLKIYNEILFLKSSFLTMGTKVQAETIYGDILITPRSLLKIKNISIRSAVDKTKFFLNILKEKNYNSFIELEILSEFKSMKEKILFKHKKYGIISVYPDNLIRGQKIDIQSILNKDDYIKKQFKKIHGNTYNYEKYEYIGGEVKSTIKCKKHGYFEQTPLTHMRGSGCDICGNIKISEKAKKSPKGWTYTNWQKAAENSKNFDSYKVYIIKCWNNDEEFYKVGRTFTTLKKRFSNNHNMPYNYSVIKEINFNNSKECCEFEKYFKNLNKKNKYKPLKKFNGFSECFDVNPKNYILE